MRPRRLFVGEKVLIPFEKIHGTILESYGYGIFKVRLDNGEVRKFKRGDLRKLPYRRIISY